MFKELLKKILKFFTRKRPRVPLVLQMELIECGAASLAMILAYYKKIVPLEVLRDDCGCSRDGTSASALIKVAKNYNMCATGYKEHNIDDLTKYKLPAIIFWNFNHFLVYNGRQDDEHYINDPAFGERIVSSKEMDESFSGILLEVYPDEGFVASGRRNSFVDLLKHRFLSYKSTIIYTLLLGVLLIPANLLTPSFSGILVDKFLGSGNYDWGTPLMFAAFLTMLLVIIVNTMQQNTLIKFNLKLSLESSFKFFEHILRLPINFFALRQPGELANRLTMVDSVANFISQQLSANILSFITLIFYGAVLIYYDALLGLMACASAIITVLLLANEIKKQRIISQSSEQDFGRLVGNTATGITLMETLKASGAEDDFYASWSGMQANAVMSNQKLEISSLFISILPSTLISLNTVGILVFGAMRVLSGSMSIGELLAFQLLVAYFFAPIITLVGMAASIQKLDVSMGRIDDVMNYKIDPILEKDEASFTVESTSKLRGDIELNNVSFGYNPIKPPIIKDFSLKINAGERVALVGPTGSGKSTLAKLIIGLHAPWSGEITFDQKARMEFSDAVFANSFAVVDQDIFMFKGTVYENLSMRNRAISIQSIQQAAMDAEIAEEISQRPSGFFSQVEEYGTNFSGGQRQRLEIARALAINPSVLVLDEATSALDPVTEMNVDRNIRRRGCTTIIIAHRLSTIRDADRIIVLSKGKIIEQGNHRELLDLRGFYSKLIKSM